MGRGRQKAKQTKVARRLKYYSPETDYRALERELTSSERDAQRNAEFDIPSVEDDAGDDWGPELTAR
ncbi:DUF3073 domain-containing protein [Georgenia faecalis]|uniref:DUF3073 domain-containing protein n=1 Tax=Georgenia faecalis TaxID=2483799 RepID=A0ABV9DDF7_9MICO|nr:DUF3073 domain-containing protein [Georgenia faecalis]